MHGLHNHFVIVDARLDPYEPSLTEIVSICDAESGIGADELIVIEAATDGSADAFMRIFNGDGRQVEACGNATRCVAWLLFEESGRDSVIIKTLAGCLPCHRISANSVSVGMGVVHSDWQSVPLASENDTLNLPLSSGPLSCPVALNVGNPHVVFFVDDLDAIDIAAYAPEIQQSELFPDSVNVGVAQLVTEDSLRLRVYERGAGLTMACGSGACAAAVAARLRGLTSAGTIDVELPGGTMTINVAEDNSVVMTGPVAVSFAGHLPAAS